MWAVVKIQRAFRKYRGRKEARQEAKQKVSSTKERWRKNAEGEQYKPPPPPPDPPRRRQQPRLYQTFTTYEASRIVLTNHHSPIFCSPGSSRWPCPRAGRARRRRRPS